VTSRRAALSVPASEPRKIAKAMASEVDEVVVDLEDAVAPQAKDAARAVVADLGPREHGSIVVRVNPVGTAWHEADVATCAAHPHLDGLVLPKAEDPADLAALAARLDHLESAAGRTRPLHVQALVESVAGVHQAVAIARSTRVVALILGYADLAVSMGRPVSGPWQFAQDAVVLAARLAGVQAIDGPQLTIADDEPLATAAGWADTLGFDGKWVIHPAQIATVQRAFTPTAEQVDDARDLLAAMDTATADGRGAVQWRGRMLDEAVAAQARRVLQRVGG